MSRVPNYSDTIIYKLCCKDPSITEIYVGNTTNFRNRKNCHKSRCNTPTYEAYVYQFMRDHGGFDNWDMIEVCRVECLDKRDAERVERKHIEELGATLNMVIPTRSGKEWTETNREHVSKVSKTWKENNPEKVTESNRRFAKTDKRKTYLKEYRESHKEESHQYYLQNREKILLKAKERCTKSKESSEIII